MTSTPELRSSVEAQVRRLSAINQGFPIEDYTFTELHRAFLQFPDLKSVAATIGEMVETRDKLPTPAHVLGIGRNCESHIRSKPADPNCGACHGDGFKPRKITRNGRTCDGVERCECRRAS